MSGLSPFARQYAIGIIVDIWGSKDGHYPMIAYQAAFTIILSLQVLAWSWYFSYELVTRLSLAAPLRQMGSPRLAGSLLGSTAIPPDCIILMRAWLLSLGRPSGNGNTRPRHNQSETLPFP